jgi:hypothetical protein
MAAAASASMSTSATVASDNVGDAARSAIKPGVKTVLPAPMMTIFGAFVACMWVASLLVLASSPPAPLPLRQERGADSFPPRSSQWERGSGGEGTYFIPAKTSALTIWRWKMRKTISTGTTAIAAAAMIRS